MIDFDLPQEAKIAKKMLNAMFFDLFRGIARKYDEHEHEPVEELQQFAPMMRGRRKAAGKKKSKPGGQSALPSNMGMVAIVSTEEMCYMDPAISAAMPGDGIGQAAIQAVGTPEQKERFGSKVTAMCITEPGCGSDSSAVRMTATLDTETNEWVINGEKIFVSGGKQAEAVVVWATLDRSKGRAAVKNFVIDMDMPGVTLVKLEQKMGLRAADTAAISFEDVRIPYDNILGSPEISTGGGFKQARKFFDLTRPAVAAIGVGVARAALEFTKGKLEGEGCHFSYDRGVHRLSAIQKDMLDMEANLDVMRLLTWRAVATSGDDRSNATKASMAKAKSGKAANQIVQKCVDLLGPCGYSREWLLEKWCRDCKINDIYEGTGQIQMLIIARNILGYGRDKLK